MAARDGDRRPLLPLQNAATGLGEFPRLPTRDLYTPLLITVSTGNPLRDYYIPRALIGGGSVYFAKTFSEWYKEGRDREVILRDVEHETFEVFVNWLYTGRIYHDEPHSRQGRVGILGG